jgi:hypothetical protein
VTTAEVTAAAAEVTTATMPLRLRGRGESSGR